MAWGLAMIRYSKLGYVELMVTDLERSAAFYREIVGLQPAGRGPGGECRFKCSEEPYAVVLHQADRPGFKRGGWMLEDDRQFAALHGRLAANGVAYEELDAAECQARGLARATRMVEPNTGATMEFYLLPAGTVSEPFAPSVARIQRLGHVVWTTPRHREAIAFFRDVLNFAQSDSIGEMITFFRAFPNPYHHGIGIAQGSETKAQSPELHGHRDRRCRPRPRALQGEGGAGGVRARPPSGLDQRVPVLPRSGRHDARIQLRHGAVSRADPRPPRRLDPAPLNINSWGSYRDPRMSAVGEVAEHTVRSEAR